MPLAAIGFAILTACSRASGDAAAGAGMAEGAPHQSASPVAQSSTTTVPTKSPTTTTCVVRAEALTNVNGASSSERALSSWLRSNAEGFNPDRIAWHSAGQQGEYADGQGHRVMVIHVDPPSHGYVVSQATTCSSP